MQEEKTLKEINRKLDIILSVLIDPMALQEVKAGKSIDDMLRDEACRRAAATGDKGYIRDYLKAKNGGGSTPPKRRTHAENKTLMGDIRG